MAECLPGMHEAPGLIPSTAKSEQVRKMERWLQSGERQRPVGMSQSENGESPEGNWSSCHMSDVLETGGESQASTHSERFLFSEKTRRMNSPS